MSKLFPITVRGLGRFVYLPHHTPATQPASQAWKVVQMYSSSIDNARPIRVITMVTKCCSAEKSNLPSQNQP